MTLDEERKGCEIVLDEAEEAWAAVGGVASDVVD